MPTDLTERLAAAITRTGKKITTTEVRNARWIQEVAPIILPLLLSEPELVASLPDAVRLSVLTPRERAVMRLGELCIKLDGPLLARTHSLVKSEYRAALAEARALAPSPAPLEGTNDG